MPLTQPLTEEETIAKEQLASQGFVNPDALEIQGQIEEGVASIQEPIPTGATPVIISGNGAKDTMDEIEEKTPLPTPATQEAARAANDPQAFLAAGGALRNGAIPPLAPTPTPSAEDVFIQKELEEGMTDEERAKAEVEARENERLERVLAFTTAQKARLSQSKQAQILNIENQAASLRARALEANRRRERLQETIGVRFGGRFVPQTTEALFQDQVDRGIQRIQELNASENRAIARVESAMDEKQASLALQEFNALEGIRSKRDEELANIEKAQTEALQAMQEEQEKITNQLAIGDLINQGITDPLAMLDLLNLDKTGKLIGNVTLEDITEVQNAIKSKESEPISFADLGKINKELEIELPFGTTNDDLERMGLVPSGASAGDFTYKTIGNQIVRIDEATGDSSVIFEGKKGEDPFTTQQRFSNTNNIRKEVTDNAKDYIIQRDSMSRIEAAASQESAAGDLALIFAFMKAQDPNSVVRESEFATAAKARAELTRVDKLGIFVPTVVLQGIKRLKTGEKLLSAQRNDFVETARVVVNTAMESQILAQAQAREFAEAMGINPDEAVPDLTLLKRKLLQQLAPNELIIWNTEKRKIQAVTEDEFDPIIHVIF